MKLIKCIKKLFKKTIKLFFKGGKAYYKAKLKGIKLNKALNGPDVEIAGIPVNDVVQVADNMKTLFSVVRSYHKLPEDHEMTLNVNADEDEAKLEFKDENGISWDYEVSKSDYGKITHDDIDFLKGTDKDLS